MAPRGRKRKSPNFKVIAGTDKKCRADDAQSTDEECGLEAPNLELPPPDYLNDFAVAEWERVVPMLLDANILKEIDTSMLAVYCQLYGDFVDCSARRVPVAASLITQMRVLADTFGLTPGGRDGLKVRSPDKKENRFKRNARRSEREK